MVMSALYIDADSDINNNTHTHSIKLDVFVLILRVRVQGNEGSFMIRGYIVIKYLNRR